MSFRTPKTSHRGQKQLECSAESVGTPCRSIFVITTRPIKIGELLGGHVT